MTFSGLSVFQLAALAVLSSGLVAAAYFLRFRHRQAAVSSLFLWRRVLEGRDRRSLWERLRRVVSAAIAILIALAIVSALGRPQLGSAGGAGSRLVLVFDTSPSMLARTADGGSRWNHALALGRRILQSRADMPVRIADTSGRYDFSFTTDRRQVREELVRIRPGAPSLAFPEVGPGDEAYFISDAVAQIAVPQEVRRLSVFERAENVGITAFQVQASPSAPLEYQAYLELKNFGTEPRSVEVVVSGFAGGDPLRRPFELAPGAASGESIDLTNFPGGGVRASIRPAAGGADAFSPDDEAFGYLPVQRRVRTLLATRGNRDLENVLAVNPLSELTVVRPEDFREDPSFDVYVFDGFAPDAPPARPALVFGAPAASWLPPVQGTVTNPEFGTALESHPVLQYVPLSEITIRQARRIDASNRTVLAASGTAPLIVASEGPRWILVAFDLAVSDFSKKVGFPVFMDNALGWLRSELPPIYRRPGAVEVPFGAEVAAVDPAGGESRPVPVRERSGSAVFEPDGAGLYVASRGDLRQYIAVNFASAERSDINRGALPASGTADVPENPPRREPWVYLLAGVFGLIVLEWMTFHRSVTV